MIFKKKDIPNMRKGEKIKQITTFKYLGSWFTSVAKSEIDIKAKIRMVKTAVAILKHILL